MQVDPTVATKRAKVCHSGARVAPKYTKIPLKCSPGTPGGTFDVHFQQNSGPSPNTIMDGQIACVGGVGGTPAPPLGLQRAPWEPQRRGSSKLYIKSDEKSPQRSPKGAQSDAQGSPKVLQNHAWDPSRCKGVPLQVPRVPLDQKYQHFIKQRRNLMKHLWKTCGSGPAADNEKGAAAHGQRKTPTENLQMKLDFNENLQTTLAKHDSCES